jgi:hypothetical protein
MSKRELNVTALTIVLSPALSGSGRFEARLQGDDRVLCLSRIPFFDSARELIAAGYDPDLDLSVRHAGSNTEILKAKLETAASLTIEGTMFGPKLRPLEALFYSGGRAKDRVWQSVRCHPSTPSPRSRWRQKKS